MAENDPTYRIYVEIPRQTLRDLLTTAVESNALGYWGRVSAVTRAKDLSVTRFKITEHEAATPDAIRVNRYLDESDIAHGIERLAAASFQTAGKHLGNALNDHDAETADVVVQMAVFGELVYG